MSKSFGKPMFESRNLFKKDTPAEKKLRKNEKMRSSFVERKRRQLLSTYDDVAVKNLERNFSGKYDDGRSAKRTNNLIKHDVTKRHNGYDDHNSKIIDKPSMKITFLGGIDEIGKNLTVFECLNDILILDCGLAFPDDTMPGVDLVLPDFTYIEENADRVKGIVVTHGHEDHIGAIPYLLKKINLPIYATPLTIGLIKSKLSEHKLLRDTKLIEVNDGQHIELGCMDVEFIHVNHSIPCATGIAIHSPAGTIVHTGDFKIDFTPTKGKMMDLTRFAELGREGVLLLMADSTNAEKPGYTLTEQRVAQTFRDMFKKASTNRIIIASFASNINRINQIIQIAVDNGRKVAFSGRSMLSNVAIAKELGYIDADDDAIIDIDSINSYSDEEIVIITTGSQGEPMSALSRMANDDHRQISIGENDVIIISAKPIPGNEKMVGMVIDELLKRNCKVIYESMYEVHVSGHACREELKLVHGLVKPKYFIPVHGERKHLVKHADLAETMGMDPKNIFIAKNGLSVLINDVFIKENATVPSGNVFVDGIGVGDVGNVVLRDRKLLSQDGLIIVVVALHVKFHTIESGPEIFSRGFVYVRESETLMCATKSKAEAILNDCLNSGITDWSVMKLKLKDGLSKFFYDRTKRKPMILPIIMGIN